MSLKTDYKDYILDTMKNTTRKFNMINNPDGTVSFEDVSEYSQTGDSFGANDINNITKAIGANTKSISQQSEANVNLEKRVTSLENNGTGSGKGLTTEQINLFEQLFNYIAFTDNVVGKTTADSLILSLRGSSNNDENDTPSEPIEPSTYNVTINAPNTSNNNDKTSGTIGESYSVTITPDENYNIDSVIVTMGGTDITSTAYADGKVNISEVTGDIIIIVTTTTTILYNLDEPMSFDDGVTTYNTGVKLFAEKDMDWSIMYDIKYEGSIGTSRFRDIVYCGSGSSADLMPLRISKDNNTGNFTTDMYAYSNNTTTGENRKGIIVHTKGSQKKIEYDLINTNGIQLTSNKVFAKVDAPIYFGGVPSEIGTIGNHVNAKCTINKFTVFNRALSQSEAITLLGG